MTTLKLETTWYAIDDNNIVIALAPTFRECDEKALRISQWDMRPGTRAPYILTTIPPHEG